MKADWTNASQEDVAAIKKWFDDWGEMVATERFEDARELFDPGAIGFQEDGEQYDRPGRTTSIFVRGDLAYRWRSIHTHVSLFRGVPQKSFPRD